MLTFFVVACSDIDGAETEEVVAFFVREGEEEKNREKMVSPRVIGELARVVLACARGRRG